MKRALGLVAAGLAALMLAGCVRIEGISFGSARRTVRPRGEAQMSMDLLLYADQVGDHTLTLEDIFFTDGGIEITIDPALEDNITLSAPEAVLDSVKVSIDHEAGIIALRGNGRVQFADADLEITLGVPVKLLTVAGGAELDARLPEVKHFTLRVDGALDGDIVFGALDTLDAEINGAGSLELDGSCGQALITVNGAADIDADDLHCTDAAITINGAGSCEIYVSGTFDAEVNGVGAIRYRGNPATVRESGGGIASVSPH